MNLDHGGRSAAVGHQPAAAAARPVAWMGDDRAPPAPACPAAPAELIATAERVCALLGGILVEPLSLDQRRRLGQRARAAVPLLVMLTAAGVQRSPQAFAADRAPDGEPLTAAGLRLRQERARALLYLYHLLAQLAQRCHDAFLREQAAAAEAALSVLRRACEEPAAPPGPRRRALREALSWWQAGCAYFKLPATPADASRHELLRAARAASAARGPGRRP